MKEKELQRATQLVSEALTKFKALHGRPVLFRGMRYTDVMRWQHGQQVENQRKQRSREASRKASRAL
eukprot:600231-Hanusia_phi.AAC.1